MQPHKTRIRTKSSEVCQKAQRSVVNNAFHNELKSRTHVIAMCGEHGLYHNWVIGADGEAEKKYNESLGIRKTGFKRTKNGAYLPEEYGVKKTNTKKVPEIEP